MKHLLIMCMVVLSGCLTLLPDHHVRFSGVHNSALVYELDCVNTLQCEADAARVCNHRGHVIVSQWSYIDDYRWLVECR